MKMAIVVLQPCQKRYIWKQTEIMACNNNWWQKMLFTSHALMKYCFRTVETNYREEQPCNLNHLWKLSNCFTLCVWNFIFISTKHQWIWHSSTRACTKVCHGSGLCPKHHFLSSTECICRKINKRIFTISQSSSTPFHCSASIWWTRQKLCSGVCFRVFVEEKNHAWICCQKIFWL